MNNKCPIYSGEPQLDIAVSNLVVRDNATICKAVARDITASRISVNILEVNTFFKHNGKFTQDPVYNVNSVQELLDALHSLSTTFWQGTATI